MLKLVRNAQDKVFFAVGVAFSNFLGRSRSGLGWKCTKYKERHMQLRAQLFFFCFMSKVGKE